MVEKLKRFFKCYFSNGPKAIFILSLILASITIFTFGMKKTLYVYIDGNEKKITTFKTTLKDALSSNGIVIGPKDKTTIGLDSKIKNKDKIYVKKAVNVELEIDGKKLALKSAEDNVENMIKAEGIKLGNKDKIIPARNYSLKDGLKIAITRVDSKILKEVKPIDYETVSKNDKSLATGETKVIQEGKSGEKLVTTEVTYENGKESSKKVISQVVTKKPVAKIVAKGASERFVASRGGNLNLTNGIRMKATCYTADYESTGKGPGDSGFGITATGTVARRVVGGYSSVAVDPRVIPLGTKLYVEGYGYAIAEDTGGAVKGNVIDLFFDNYADMDRWGSRWVNVYILN